MDTESQKIVQQAFDSLPKDIQEVVFADDYQQILLDIAKKYNLTMEQLHKLEFQTTMVLMGLDSRAYFPFNLELELGIEEEIAQPLSQEINDIIFATVEESLDTIDKENVGDDGALNAKLDYEERKFAVGNPENSPIPNSSLATLSDRLKQASIAAPAKRDYSLGKSTDSAAVPESTAPVSAPTIDPYHEPVDNE
ncbi:MAG: hypothetical protein JWM92_283 [Candidatus Nomurabacteria bacterium]|nr:hypothetical protein [Candidatus Nomurabacteria bacterium]